MCRYAASAFMPDLRYLHRHRATEWCSGWPEAPAITRSAAPSAFDHLADGNDLRVVGTKQGSLDG